MGNRFAVIFLILACIGFLAAGASFLRESGMLRKRPKAEYLTEEEEAVRPAYSQLSQKEKACYTALYRGISERKEKIPLPYDINGDTYTKLYCLVEKQESELFYVSSTYYNAEIVGEAKIVYRFPAEQFDQRKIEFDVEKDIALNVISSARTDQEKARRIHDYIIMNCTYVIGDDDSFGSTAYGCIVERKANCEGYAKAFDLLAREVGLTSVLVTGTTDKGENHAWNQVMIDEKWYNLDVTWDDTDVPGQIRKVYFLCDDEVFGQTHFADRETFEPFDCGDGSKDYYVANGLLANTETEAYEILCREISSGKDSIEIKFTDHGAYSDFRRDMFDTQRIFDVAMECRNEYRRQVSVTLSENEALMSMLIMLEWE